MIVLVIGQQGQLARALGSVVLPAGMRMVSIGRPLLDLLQPDTITRAVERARPNLVVNAAAYTAVEKAESETELAFAVNGNGAGNLAAACASCEIPLVHLSTNYVYDGTKSSPYVESDEVNPISAYGRSKLAGERQVAEINPRHLILRTASVYSSLGTNFVTTMLRLAASRPNIRVVDDQTSNPSYAPHLAEAILTLASRMVGAPADDPRWGVYHAVCGGCISWFGFACALFRRASAYGLTSPQLTPITTAEYPTKAKRPVNGCLDTTKLKESFGVVLPPWADGLQDCVAQLAEVTNGTLQWWLEPGSLSAAHTPSEQRC